MKWKIKRHKNAVEFTHSFYMLRFEKILPKGSFGVEVYKDDQLRVQRIGKNFRVALHHFYQLKRLIARGF